MTEGRKKMTTDAGRPVGDNQNSLTVGPRGPVVFEDFLLFEKMAHFNRERIPERVVHAKGSGAHGHFVCSSKEISKYTLQSYSARRGRRRRRSSGSQLSAAKRDRRIPNATRADSL